MKRFYLLSAGALLALLTASYCPAQPIPFDSGRWAITAEENRIETFQGQQALYLQGGNAVLPEVAFTDGEIAFDVAFSEARSFTGIFWRQQDEANFEYFYFRPHQSGNPDANQYTPVFNGLAGWQLYYGEAYSAPVPYTFDAWIPVKVVVSGTQAEVYIDNLETPALFIPELKRPVAAGSVGLIASNLAPARFANFRVTPMEQPPLKATAQAREATPRETVMAWSVSNVMPEQAVEGKHHLTAADKAALTWTTLSCEATGVANLARVQGIDEARNTAFARLRIRSDRAQVKKLTFGFSDRVRVYFNDRLLYSGDDLYQSRDYRFLGTIGYFDALYLPLEQGENELWMAVSEGFGGWGLKAMFEDLEGLEVRP